MWEGLESRRMLAGDVAVSLPGVLPADVPAGLSKNAIVVRLTNVGDALLVSAGAVDVKVFASSDEVLDGGDFNLGTATRKSLRLGVNGKSDVKIVYPSPNLASGEYFIIAQLNGAGDGNAANDTAISTTKVTFHQPFVDLTAEVGGLPVKPINLSSRGVKLNSKAIVTNHGNVTARGPLTIDFYSSYTGEIDATSTLLGTSTVRNAIIKPGKSKTIPIGAKLTAATPSGAFVILAVVNANEVIPETDVSNNTAHAANPLTIVNPAIPAAPALATPLISDVGKLLVGQPQIVGLSVAVAQANDATSIEVFETDGSGNVTGTLTSLFDDGSEIHNDITAGDGVFNNTVSLGFNETDDHFYLAKMKVGSSDVAQTDVLPISVIPVPTEAELQAVADHAASVQTQIAADVDAGQDNPSVLAAAKARLEADPSVQQGSVEVSNSGILWRNVFNGIFCDVDLQALKYQGLRGGGPIVPTDLVAAASNAVVPAADETPKPSAKRAIVIGPFAWQFENNDEYDDIGFQLSEVGWNVTVKGNSSIGQQNVTVDDFRNLNQYGAVVISTHGGNFQASKSLINTGQLLTPTTYTTYAADISDGKVSLTNGIWLSVTSAFIARYSAKFPSSIIYVGSCHSTEDTTLASAFLSHGAKAFIGYSKSVTPKWAYERGISAFDVLTGATNNTVGDIPGINSASDPETGAVFRMFGDKKAKLPDQSDLLKENEVIIHYTWPQTQKDLDTTTTFLNQSEGYSNPNESPYVQWGGDNTSTGGSETATVDIYNSQLAGLWSGSTTITAAAGWFQSSGGTGPAEITVALRNTVTGVVHQVLRKTIIPGQQTGAATALVATITVTLTGEPANPSVLLALS